jgi:uncharacterized protein YpiB (UPF0302 family)
MFSSLLCFQYVFLILIPDHLLAFAKHLETLQFAAVMEENPFMPKNIQISEQDRLIVESFLSSSIEKFQREKLVKLIDESLDNQDEEAFRNLTDQLNKLHL